MTTIKARVAQRLMKARFAHVNLIARDWQRLVQFYTTVFGCILVPPERDFQGAELDAGTGNGLKGARLRGAHFRLPGGGGQGPTLEIFTYVQLEPSSPAAANRPGFGHIAFQVEVPAPGCIEPASGAIWSPGQCGSACSPCSMRRRSARRTFALSAKTGFSRLQPGLQWVIRPACGLRTAALTGAYVTWML